MWDEIDQRLTGAYEHLASLEKETSRGGERILCNGEFMFVRSVNLGLRIRRGFGNLAYRPSNLHRKRDMGQQGRGWMHTMTPGD